MMHIPFCRLGNSLINNSPNLSGLTNIKLQPSEGERKLEHNYLGLYRIQSSFCFNIP